MSAARLAHPLFGLDYTSEIPTSALRSAGVQFVVRYLSRYTAKVITPGEYQRLTAAGIGVALVFEDSATNAKLGHGQGLVDAQFALKQAIAICGEPKVARGIPAAVDYDPAGDAALTDPYFDAWATVRGARLLAGPYGGIEVTRRQADRGFGTLYQTYAWSGGIIDARAGILQYSNDHVIGGHGVDFDHAFLPDYYQWGYTPPAPPDPFAIHPNEWMRVGTPGHEYRLNEHELVVSCVAALQHSQRDHAALERMWPQLKVLRDRCKRLAFFTPDGKRRPVVLWADDRQFGRRWQSLNGLMSRIAKLGLVK